jgi:hypothetical protein
VVGLELALELQVGLAGVVAVEKEILARLVLAVLAAVAPETLVTIMA